MTSMKSTMMRGRNEMMAGTVRGARGQDPPGIRPNMHPGRTLKLLALLLAADATAMTAGPVAATGDPRLSAQEVSAEERLFLAARSLINQTRWADAARQFRYYRTRYSKGRYLGDAFYWEAFARHRQGQLEQAVLLLDNMLENVPDSVPDDESNARRVNDARQLRLRILGEMAEKGDPRAAQEVLRQSEAALGAALDSASVALDSAAAAMSVAWDSLAVAMSTAWDSLAQVMVPAFDTLAAAMGPALDSLADVISRQLPEAIDTIAATIDAADMSRFERALTRLEARNRQLPEHCEDESVQQEALTSVLRLVETDRVPILRGVINRDDECSVNLRVYAVGRLAREGTPEAERELIGVAAAHPDLEARRAAVSGLRWFDTPTALAALVNVLARSNDAKMREAAIGGLRRSENASARNALAAFAADASQPEGLREDAIVALGRRDDVEAEALIRLYATLDTEKLKTALFDRLRDSRSKQAEAWLFNLAFNTNEASRIRSRALDAWARSPSVDLSVLVEAYRRLGESDLRERIFYALYRKAGRSKGEAKSEVVRKMVELARLEPDPEVRERAVAWLGRTGSPEAVEFLLELLRGPQRDTLPKTGRLPPPASHQLFGHSFQLVGYMPFSTHTTSISPSSAPTMGSSSSSSSSSSSPGHRMPKFLHSHSSQSMSSGRWSPPPPPPEPPPPDPLPSSRPNSFSFGKSRSPQSIMS